MVDLPACLGDCLAPLLTTVGLITLYRVIILFMLPSPCYWSRNITSYFWLHLQAMTRRMLDSWRCLSDGCSTQNRDDTACCFGVDGYSAKRAFLRLPRLTAEDVVCGPFVPFFFFFFRASRVDHLLDLVFLKVFFLLLFRKAHCMAMRPQAHLSAPKQPPVVSRLITYLQPAVRRATRSDILMLVHTSLSCDHIIIFPGPDLMFYPQNTSQHCQRYPAVYSVSASR